VVEKGLAKAAIFATANGNFVMAREGETVSKEYKLLRIGAGSVTISHLDGTGLVKIPMDGDRRGSVLRPNTARQRDADDQVLTDHPASGFTPWKFGSDSRTHSCWLAALAPNARDVTALAPAPPDACR
jgi:hypothetical protein